MIEYTMEEAQDQFPEPMHTRWKLSRRLQQRPMRVTVQQRFVDPEFKEYPYMEIRLRAKRLGGLSPGDVVEVAPDENGNLIIKKKGVELCKNHKPDSMAK